MGKKEERASGRGLSFFRGEEVILTPLCRRERGVPSSLEKGSSDILAWGERRGKTLCEEMALIDRSPVRRGEKRAPRIPYLKRQKKPPF